MQLLLQLMSHPDMLLARIVIRVMRALFVGAERELSR
jgi:hypothetical protein